MRLLCASVLATKSPPSLAERLLSYFLTTDASPKTFKTTSSSPFSLRSHQGDGTKDAAQQKLDILLLPVHEMLTWDLGEDSGHLILPVTPILILFCRLRS